MFFLLPLLIQANLLKASQNHTGNKPLSFVKMVVALTKMMALLNHDEELDYYIPAEGSNTETPTMALNLWHMYFP